MNNERFRQSILFIGDFFLYYLGVLSLWIIDLYIRRMDNVFAHDYFLGFSTFLPLFFVVYYIFDLYADDITMDGISLLKASINASAISSLLAFLWLHKFRFFFYVRSILSFVIFAFIIFTFFSLWRRLYFALFAHRRSLIPTVILGDPTSLPELQKEINERPFCGITLKRFFNPKTENIQNLRPLIEKEKAEYLIVADEWFYQPSIVHELFRSLPLRIEIIRQSSFLENLCHRVFLNHIGETWFIDHLSDNNKRINDRLKSISDRFMALILLIFLLPLLSLIAILVGISSGFPVIYKQTRVGYLGKDFILYKFRTMKKDAEKDGAQWSKPGDQRITPFGKFLRKTRLDELPQLLNILKGEMSFIGPRPERPEFVGLLNQKIAFYNERHLVKPGLTGWAQVTYRYGMNEDDALKKLQYDLYYIKNRSFVLDLAIFLKTIRVVIYQTGT